MTEQPNPYSETFSHLGKPVRVTMTQPTLEKVAGWTSAPEETPGRETIVFFTKDIAYAVPPTGVTEPTVVFGVFCPAAFIVEGLSYVVKFTTRRSSDRAKDIAIDTLGIIADKTTSVSTDGLGAIPADKLLAASLNAASVTLVAYPPHYDGPRLTLSDGGSLVPLPDSTLVTDDRVRVFPVISGTVQMPDDFPMKSAGVEKLVGEKRLREVARIVKGTEATGWTRLVAKRLGVGERHARRLVNDARAAGFLDPLPETDLRTRRNKK